MRIATKRIGPADPPYIIAELGVNHDGSLSCALELVDAAADAGADAIKLQYFRAARLLGRDAGLAEYQRRSGEADARSMLESLELPDADIACLIEHAHAQSLHAIVTVFSAGLVSDLHDMDVDALKTASPDIVNRPLIDALRATGRPLLVSAGAASLEEIAATSVWLGETPHVFLHCVSAYPTPDDEARLNGRRAMLAVTPHALGYSDHTTSIDTGALAVAGGACLLEKHLTHDRGAAGPDHAASLDPDGLREYVRLAHRAWRMNGPVRKDVLPIEQEVRNLARQSLTIARALPAGHRLQRDDLVVKRPGTGIAPTQLEQTVGRTLARSMQCDETLHVDHLVAEDRSCENAGDRVCT